MNFKYYGLYYTVIKNRDDKETVDEQYEDNQKDYFSFNDLITPKNKVSIQPREPTLR